MTDRLLLASLLLALLSACASTGHRDSHRTLSPEDPLAMPVPDFVIQQRDMRIALERGVPRQLSDAEWERLNRIHVTFDRILTDVTDINQVSSNDRRLLYHLHAEVRSTVFGEQDDNEIVCARVYRTGTRHGGQHYCLPRSSWELGRLHARDTMRDIESMARPAPR